MHNRILPGNHGDFQFEGKKTAGSPSQAQRIFAEAGHSLVGGVTAGARFSPLFPTPFFAARAAGSRITAVDGQTYLDLHTSFGAALLGHGQLDAGFPILA